MPKRAVNPLRIGNRWRMFEDLRTMTKEKAISSSCGRKEANSREYSPGTSLFANSQVGSFNYEKQSETQEDRGSAFNS